MTSTRAAVMWEAGKKWDVVDLELDAPRENEVLVRFEVAGLCHSDDHLRTGHGLNARYPIVGGHEGAGVVEAVGPNVSRVEVGQRVVMSFIPACGTCRWCSVGSQALCNKGLNAANGMLLDNTFRLHHGQTDVGAFCVLGAFSERATVSEYSCIPLPDDIGFEAGALLGCGVPTGWGSSVYGGPVAAGEVVVIYGVGGVGMNAVQGARFAGASKIVVVEPIDWKRDKALSFGATDCFASHQQAAEFITETTHGAQADVAIVTVGVSSAEIIKCAASTLGKLGRLVLTASGATGTTDIDLNVSLLKGYMQRVQGVLFGNCNPLYDVPRLFELYRSGALMLDELITSRYTLDDVNLGYADLLAGRILKGVIVYA